MTVIIKAADSGAIGDRVFDDQVLPTSMIYRWLDTDGDGGGTQNAIGNYAAGQEFKITAPAGECYVLVRLIINLADTGPLSADNYGGLAALTNGIVPQVTDADGTQVLDLSDGVLVKTNAQWAQQCHDVEASQFGSGIDYISVRWTFEKSGNPIFLKPGWSFGCLMQDDLTGLVRHYFQVQGYKVTI